MDVARLNFSHGTHEEHGARLERLRQASGDKKKAVAALQDLCGPKIRTGRFPAKFDLPTGSDDHADRGRPQSERRAHHPDPVRRPRAATCAWATASCSTTAASCSPSRPSRATRAGPRRAGRRHARSHRRAPAQQDDAHLGAHRERQEGPVVRAVAGRRLHRAVASCGAPRTCTWSARSARRGDSPRPSSPRSRRPTPSRTSRASSRRPTASWWRAAISASSSRPSTCRSSSGRSSRGAPRAAARHRRHRDAAVDDEGDAPHARRSERRGQRGLRRDRRLMLSGETATGDHPSLAAAMMSAHRDRGREERVLRAGAVRCRARRTWPRPSRAARSTRPRRSARKFIVAFTESGSSAMNVSLARPNVPIIAFSPNEKTRRRMALYWGVIPRVMPADPRHGRARRLVHGGPPGRRLRQPGRARRHRVRRAHRREREHEQHPRARARVEKAALCRVSPR